jgi:hypothetical protein
VELYEKDPQKKVPAPVNAAPKPSDKGPALHNQMGAPQKGNNEPHPVLISEPAKHRQANEEAQPVKNMPDEIREPAHHINKAPNPPKVEPIENHPPKVNKPSQNKTPRNPASPQNSKKTVKDGNGGY